MTDASKPDQVEGWSRDWIDVRYPGDQRPHPVWEAIVVEGVVVSACNGHKGRWHGRLSINSDMVAESFECSDGINSVIADLTTQLRQHNKLSSAALELLEAGK